VRVTRDKEDHEPAAVKLLRLVGAAIVAGVLIGLIALPGLGSAGVAARDAADSFQNMSTDMGLAPPPERSAVYGADGSLLAQFYYHDRQSIRLDQISPLLQHAVVAIEDSRFYQHGPIDLKGVLRAAVTDSQSGTATQGASTLTQQYVKNLLVENATTPQQVKEAQAETLARKLRELRYAVGIEQHETKDQILEGYLNIAYFGSGAYGAEAAAQYYFGVDASKLTLPESALLAGVTNSPSNYDPQADPAAALTRRNTVLMRMAQLHYITHQQATQAAATKIVLHIKVPKSECVSSKTPYFCEYVKNDLLADPALGATVADRETKLYRGGLTIHTTLDMQAQRAAQKAVDNRRPGSRDAAETMVQPGTGQIKAMVTSQTYGDNVHKGQTTINLAADYAHGGNGGYSIGSTAKIFTLAAALQNGIPVSTAFKSPAHMVVDGFTDCDGDGLGSWDVSNAEPGDNGMYNLDTGTWGSINTFYAQLEKEVGVCNAVKMAQNFGMKQATGKKIDHYPSFTLGADQYDVTHLAAAYAGFAARGKYCSPIAITNITDAEGHKYSVPKANCNQAVDQDTADEVTSILQGVLDKPGGTAVGEGLNNRPAAGKTGTCESFSCALFAGYTPNMAAVVWYGDADAPNSDPQYGVFGRNIAPIWRQSMLGALRGKPVGSFHAPVGDFGASTQANVPNVQGMSVAAAESRLSRAGFQFTISPQLAQSPQPKGKVAFTSPSGGTQADTSTPVMIFVSDGTDFTGKSKRKKPGLPWPFG
jgi:membrane peptidoglycan carboxypeptidase